MQVRKTQGLKSRSGLNMIGIGWKRLKMSASELKMNGSAWERMEADGSRWEWVGAGGTEQDWAGVSASG